MGKDLTPDENVLTADMEEIPDDDKPVTAKHHTVWVNVLAKQTTDSGKFGATGGCHVNSNNIFKEY